MRKQLLIVYRIRLKFLLFAGIVLSCGCSKNYDEFRKKFITSGESPVHRLRASRLFGTNLEGRLDEEAGYIAFIREEGEKSKWEADRKLMTLDQAARSTDDVRYLVLTKHRSMSGKYKTAGGRGSTFTLSHQVARTIVFDTYTEKIVAGKTWLSGKHGSYVENARSTSVSAEARRNWLEKQFDSTISDSLLSLSRYTGCLTFEYKDFSTDHLSLYFALDLVRKSPKERTNGISLTADDREQFDCWIGIRNKDGRPSEEWMREKLNRMHSLLNEPTGKRKRESIRVSSEFGLASQIEEGTNSIVKSGHYQVILYEDMNEDLEIKVFFHPDSQNTSQAKSGEFLKWLVKWLEKTSS